MPWINLEVVTDDDKPDVGRATAQWRIAGGIELRPYSRRAKMSVEDGQAFVAEAIADRDAQVAKGAQDANLTGTLKTFFTDAGEAVE